MGREHPEKGHRLGAGGKLTGEWPEEAFDKIVHVNLEGVWLCMKAELEQMVRPSCSGSRP
jgi:NAD(P)-dependent dehydrogenase (short-subunit alcohol dehydrogenase family)